VKAIQGLLVLGVASCSTLSETEQPPYRSVPGAFLSDTGASLYAIEAFDDWLDDGRDLLSHTIPRSEEDYRFFDPADPPTRVQNKGTSWMGEQALRLVLRWALSRETSKANFIGHSDFQLKSGHPITLTLFNPVPEYPQPGAPGNRTAFRVRLKATSCKDPDLVSLEWEAEKLTDGPDTEEAERPGQFPRTCERINLGSGVLPRGATLFMHYPKGSNRSTYLLLRIASVDP
jgi:hypothetical protein